MVPRTPPYSTSRKRLSTVDLLQKGFLWTGKTFNTSTRVSMSPTNISLPLRRFLKFESENFVTGIADMNLQIYLYPLSFQCVPQLVE